MANRNRELDLREVNPIGRLDVLAYKLVERLTGHLEKKIGLEGVWPAIESDVQKLVTRGLGQLDIPNEARILLAIMQANMIKEKVMERKEEKP
jgi:hypothetical protein